MVTRCVVWISPETTITDELPGSSFCWTSFLGSPGNEVVLSSVQPRRRISDGLQHQHERYFRIVLITIATIKRLSRPFHLWPYWRIILAWTDVSGFLYSRCNLWRWLPLTRTIVLHLIMIWLLGSNHLRFYLYYSQRKKQNKWAKYWPS